MAKGDVHGEWGGAMHGEDGVWQSGGMHGECGKGGHVW